MLVTNESQEQSSILGCTIANHTQSHRCKQLEPRSPPRARLWVHGFGFVALVYGSDHARGKPGSGSLCWPWALARPKGPETQRDSLPSPSKEVTDPWSIIRYILFMQQPVQMTGASGSRNTEGKRWSKEVSRVTWCLRCESNACYSVGETRQLRRDI